MENRGNGSMSLEKSCLREGIARVVAGQGNGSTWGEEPPEEKTAVYFNAIMVFCRLPLLSEEQFR
jgi:hypothetical protein